MRRALLTATVPGVAPPAAPVMQGSRASNGVTTGTTLTCTLPAGVTAGEYIRIEIGGSRLAALSSSMTGYTRLVEAGNANASGAGFVSVWGKFAVGGDANPVFNTGAGNTNMTYVAERWSGVVSVSSALTGVNYTSASPAMTSNTVVTTVANSVVATTTGGRTFATGDVSPVWGGGAAAHNNAASGRIGFCNSGIETVASPASVTHTCSITNAQASPSSNIGSVILAPA